MLPIFDKQKLIVAMRKKYNQLTAEQRYQIEALYRTNHSNSFIAGYLGVHKSTISRELKRNKTKTGRYNAFFAEELTKEKKERFSKHRRFNDSMNRFIKEKLINEQWSPEQIKGYCDQHHIQMVSHERIYQFIRHDKSIGGQLYTHLRTGHKKRRKKYGKSSIKQTIKGRIFIDQRPEQINNRTRYGDWEIDTIIGKGRTGAILTVVERKSQFTLMAKLPGKNAKDTAKAMIQLLAPYKSMVLSITSDNGTEFAEHKLIAKKLNADFYFAHPYSSWERGLSEYTNKLIRQYIPKKTDFKTINNQYINQITLKLNRRPRKKLDYNTPIKHLLTNFNPKVALAC